MRPCLVIALCAAAACGDSSGPATTITPGEYTATADAGNGFGHASWGIHLSTITQQQITGTYYGPINGTIGDGMFSNSTYRISLGTNPVYVFYLDRTGTCTRFQYLIDGFPYEGTSCTFTPM